MSISLFVKHGQNKISRDLNTANLVLFVMSASTVSYLLHGKCARVAHSSAYIRVRYKSLVQYLAVT